MIESSTKKTAILDSDSILLQYNILMIHVQAEMFSADRSNSKPFLFINLLSPAITISQYKKVHLTPKIQMV